VPYLLDLHLFLGRGHKMAQRGIDTDDVEDGILD